MADTLRPQCLLPAPQILALPPLIVELAGQSPDDLCELVAVDVGAIEFPQIPLVLVLQIQVFGDCPLFFLEGLIILDLIIFCLGEFEADGAELMLQATYFHLVSVDLPEVELYIVLGG